MNYIILFVVCIVLYDLFDYLQSIKRYKLWSRFEQFEVKRRAILKASREKVLFYYRMAYMYEKLSKDDLVRNLRKDLKFFSDYRADYIDDYHREISLLLLLVPLEAQIDNTCIINRKELLENDCWIFDLTLSQLTKEKLQKKFDKMPRELRKLNVVWFAKQELEDYLSDHFELEICISKKAS